MTPRSQGYSQSEVSPANTPVDVMVDNKPYRYYEPLPNVLVLGRETSGRTRFHDYRRAGESRHYHHDTSCPCGGLDEFKQ